MTDDQLERLQAWVAEMRKVEAKYGDGPNVWSVAATISVDDVEALLDRVEYLEMTR